MVARVLVAVLAIVVLAWLGVMERDTRLLATWGPTSRTEGVRAADDQLRSATFLNPDTTPDLQRGLLYLGNRRLRRSAATVQGVLRREPDNIDAWGELFLVGRGHDRSLVHRARNAVRRLDPVDYGGASG